MEEVEEDRNKRLERSLQDISHLFLSSIENPGVQVPRYDEVSSEKPVQTYQPENHNKRVCIVSCHDIVTRSFLTCNLALALSKRWHMVTILDLEQDTPNVEFLLENEISSYGNTVTELDSVPLRSIGFKKIENLHLLRWDSNSPVGMQAEDIPKIALDQILSRNDIEPSKSHIVLINLPDTLQHSLGNSLLAQGNEMILISPSTGRGMLQVYLRIKMACRANPNMALGIVVTNVSRASEARAVYEKLFLEANRFLNKRIHYYGYIFEDIHLTRSVLGRRPLMLSDLKFDLKDCINDIARRYIGFAERQLNHKKKRYALDAEFYNQIDSEE